MMEEMGEWCLVTASDENKISASATDMDVWTNLIGQETIFLFIDTWCYRYWHNEFSSESVVRLGSHWRVCDSKFCFVCTFCTFK